MSHALKILSDVKAVGGRVELMPPDGLHVSAPRALVEQVKAHKPEIIRFLSAPESLTSAALSFDREAFDERAAIIEANGVPRAWAEGLSALNPNMPPVNIPASRWLLFINDCGRFLDHRWAARACQLGWGPLDLFGCDSLAPVVRIDHQGLLWLMEGRKLIDLNRNAAIIECGRGIRQTYRRHPAEASRVVTAWELQRT